LYSPKGDAGKSSVAHTVKRRSLRVISYPRLSQINEISDPTATIIVAISPTAVPSRENPRKVKAANPKVMDRYTLRKKSRNRPSGLDAMEASHWRVVVMVSAIPKFVEGALPRQLPGCGRLDVTGGISVETYDEARCTETILKFQYTSYPDLFMYCQCERVQVKGPSTCRPSHLQSQSQSHVTGVTLALLAFHTTTFQLTRPARRKLHLSALLTSRFSGSCGSITSDMQALIVNDNYLRTYPDSLIRMCPLCWQSLLSFATQLF
jgi:hypothetical protein